MHHLTVYHLEHQSKLELLLRTFMVTQTFLMLVAATQSFNTCPMPQSILQLTQLRLLQVQLVFHGVTANLTV